MLTLACVGGDLHLKGGVLVGQVAQERDQLGKHVPDLWNRIWEIKNLKSAG